MPRGGLPNELLDATQGRRFEWRFDPALDFVPQPVSEGIVPECEERCDVAIQPTAGAEDANLLDVEQTWIVYEGTTRPWWRYEVLPGSER